MSPYSLKSISSDMLFTILLVCVLGSAVIANAQICYFPDGSVSPLDTRCHSLSVGDGASACCASSDICLSNGLCLQSDAEVVSRSSCTDRTWQSPDCSQYCNDGKYLSEIPEIYSKSAFNLA